MAHFGKMVLFSYCVSDIVTLPHQGVARLSECDVTRMGEISADRPMGRFAR